LREARIESMGDSGQEPAKYINSPESAIYKKREAVFGLYQGRNAARREDRLVLVEGNFDVVSLHARGIENVAAPLGTAFTPEQAAQVRRFTQNVVILFDADGAGRRAAISAREPCQQEGLVAKVASLPDGFDPDDLVRKQGPDALRTCLRSAKGMLEYQIESALDSGFSAADPETQGAKIQEVLELIRAETDPTVRALAQTHADTIASRLGIADVRTMQALSRAVRQAGRAADDAGARARPEPRRTKQTLGALHRDILAALTEYPMLLDDPNVVPYLAHASGSLALGISVIVRCKDAHGSDGIGDHLGSFPDELRPLIAKHVAAPEFDDDKVARRVLLDNLARMAAVERKLLKAHLEEELRSARSVGDNEREVELLRELMQLGRERLGQTA
jgi:DNA primase